MQSNPNTKPYKQNNTVRWLPITKTIQIMEKTPQHIPSYWKNHIHCKKQFTLPNSPILNKI